MDRIKVTMPIHKLYVNTESKDGTPYKNPRVVVNTDEDLVADESFNGWVSFFDNDNRASEWKEGMEVEVQLYKKESGGQIYWNIYMPGKMDRIEERLQALEDAVFKKRVSVVKESKEELPF